MHKVINNFVYIIPLKLDYRIFNQEFNFEKFNPKPSRSISLKTPSKEFNLQHFLDYAVGYYNANCSNILVSSKVIKVEQRG